MTGHPRISASIPTIGADDHAMGGSDDHASDMDL